MKEILINREAGKGSLWVTIPDEDYPPLVSGNWSEEEDLILRRLYPNYTARLVARTLSRDIDSVTGRASCLGIKKRDHLLAVAIPDTLGRVA